MATVQTAFRLDETLLGRIDALAQRLSTRWMRPTRADIVRMLLERGVDELEKEAAPKKRSPK